MNATIRGRRIQFGQISGAGGSVSPQTVPINCTEGEVLSARFEAVGWGKCSPSSVSVADSTSCAGCAPVCQSHACYVEIEDKSIGHCGMDVVCQTTVSNPLPVDVLCQITGGADDELLVNGSPVDAGCCIFANGCNGAHNVNYVFPLAAGASFSLAAGDNHGGGSGYNLTICFTPSTPVPPP